MPMNAYSYYLNIFVEIFESMGATLNSIKKNNSSQFPKILTYRKGTKIWVKIEEKYTPHHCIIWTIFDWFFSLSMQGKIDNKFGSYICSMPGK